MKPDVPILGVLLLAGLLVGCGSRRVTPPLTEVATTSEVCPAVGEANDDIKTLAASGKPISFSVPPRAYATAHDVTVEMTKGESEWCGVVSDAFHVVTSDVPLTVHSGETVVIPNPLPNERIHEAGVAFNAETTSPTPTAGTFSWPFGPSHGPGHELHFDAKGATFVSESKPGRYVVSVWLSFAARPDMFSSSNREAYYALLLDVTE
jgi:hypothetical protein